MKKTYFFIGVAVLVTMILSSCSSWMAVSKTEEVKTRNVIGVGVVHIPTIADLEVSPQKHTETFEIRVPKDKNNPNSRNEAAKALATAQLLNKHNADVLMEPRFYVEEAGFGSVALKVTVSGYPATYKNFRPMVPADTALIGAKVNYIMPTQTTGTLTSEGK